MTIEKTPTPDQLNELLSSPAACTIFAHRALISAKKGDRPPMDVLLGWLRRASKVDEAIRAVEGLRMREVAQLIEDEVRLNEQAAARGARERAAREEAAARLLEAAGGVLPDLRERFA
ncbi:hypothetical protein EOW65_15800 [Sinirhodobacter ferrireducens]|uniref:Uncharacterized protein n=1 Tax=Paenirhodobacter ferrireducens TaxID=1215032 RepID=A0A443L974_9RHOB|nr:hypothetical protein [Sinirhodobacter ferrireducens]RWR45702.1 hypothetical protein EOW65_15800 [Sinirhodobacter ferrireducens]